MEVTEAEILASMGNLAMFRGRYGEALKLLEQSRQKYESLRMPHQTAVAELEIADIYAELNLFSDAEQLYRPALATLHRLKLKAEEARGRMNLGKAALSLEKHPRQGKNCPKRRRFLKPKEMRSGCRR